VIIPPLHRTNRRSLSNSPTTPCTVMCCGLSRVKDTRINHLCINSSSFLGYTYARMATPDISYQMIALGYGLVARQLASIDMRIICTLYAVLRTRAALS
jgi:hypothetical protein